MTHIHQPAPRIALIIDDVPVVTLITALTNAGLSVVSKADGLHVYSAAGAQLTFDEPLPDDVLETLVGDLPSLPEDLLAGVQLSFGSQMQKPRQLSLVRTALVSTAPARDVADQIGV